MEEVSSNARDVILQIHAGLVYVGNLVLKPIIAVLNYFDETGSFARYLRRQEKSESNQRFMKQYEMYLRAQWPEGGEK